MLCLGDNDGDAPGSVDVTVLATGVTIVTARARPELTCLGPPVTWARPGVASPAPTWAGMAHSRCCMGKARSYMGRAQTYIGHSQPTELTWQGPVVTWARPGVAWPVYLHGQGRSCMARARVTCGGRMGMPVIVAWATPVVAWAGPAVTWARPEYRRYRIIILRALSLIHI